MDSLLALTSAFTTVLSDFHFLRPLWLLLLAPTPILLWLLKQRAQRTSAWQQVIDPSLHSVMLEQDNGIKKKSVLWPYWAIAWLIAVIALAGPASVKIPQPVSKNQQALIILLDMSASMAAQDVTPSRATRAIQKITDIVRTRKDGVTALIAYSGDAHTVTPLTDDTRTIETLLPALSPFIMPAPGSRPEKAVKLARQLANNAGVKQADILLITDGIETKDIERINNELRSGLKLSIISVGTQEGAPIPMPSGGFLRDGRGQIVIPGLDTGPIKQLSSKLNVPWRSLSLDDSDWQSLVSQPHELEQDSNLAKQEFDLWRDDGYWLILLILPFALLLFRRGVLLCVPFAFFLTLSLGSAQTAEASPWHTQDQKGAQLFNENPQLAAQEFSNEAWQGSAYYRAGDYENATKAFEQAPDSAENLYNLGNALAQNGQYKEAIKAYEQALKKQADFPQAIKNKEIVKEALKQQEQQQQDGDGDSDSQDSSDNNPENSDGQNQDSEGESPNNDSQENNSQDQGSNNSSEQDDYDPQRKDREPQSNDAENNQDSDKNSDQADAQQNDESAAEENEQDSPATASELSNDGLSREEQEAMQKWLQRVPDNPGNLLQRKFLYQYRQAAPEDTDSGEVLW